MDDFFVPKKIIDNISVDDRDLFDEDGEIMVDASDFITKDNRVPFHVGKSSDGINNRDVKSLSCIHCNSTVFHVGKGAYYTAIRCTKCGWEVCIHEG